MEALRFERLNEICKMFLDEGIQPLHENCMNYGGMGMTYTLKLLDNVKGLKLVWDTGNPVFTADYAKGKPYPRQIPFEFYSRVKEFISYVHIKDCVWSEEKQDAIYTFPGEGDGDIKRIVADLLSNGYDGGFSIEPHLAAVFHDDNVTSDESKMFDTYVEYGKRFMELFDNVKKSLD
jgi:sugar phosphate isomerase/epimerase